MKHALFKATLTLAASLAPASRAHAHTATGMALGLQSGLLHPVTGLDHLVAMVAVGLWGAQLGNPAIFLLPITFPLVMAVGGLLGILGVTLPFGETAIALSGIALGLLVALRARPPLAVAMLLVSAFAIFHGYAHGRELPQAADPLAYAVGFVVATGLLHLCGILIGLLVRWPLGEQAVRACGLVVGGVGVYFFLAAVGALG
jgi:urease accessory protein